ncbi:hypothetical protein A3C26_04425 [Candidatus Daviesbacteria bacterium RIFCSPHIGHO2_02_FULL_39_12]|uniref:Uncharacterized protein n=2 Tax=Candidatus Daviesiibacteriota TaxID=1752718 RepID=A0A1F5J8T5_9BACT|nr:MAG: hypothetical protein A3C26_04425 [Candidatus Daviesbacteria bacterium RIFCSPHIGHO2_02_FULL_39_12]OGE71625.1 MAG: hypothetical protein A3H40_01295 [Candidatus Daviesbacteria bacterium RIFCSPLOWO2_02_FULL_38_15]
MDDQNNQPTGNDPISSTPAPEPQQSAAPVSEPVTEPVQEEKCMTCGNPAQAGSCSACGQNQTSCTCPPGQAGGQGEPASPDANQGGPSVPVV